VTGATRFIGSVVIEELREAGHRLSMAISNDMPASGAVTQQSVGWRPTGPGLLEGLLGDYLG
jgi:NAD dependent epimerase/dehydratase family enzyme